MLGRLSRAKERLVAREVAVERAVPYDTTRVKARVERLVAGRGVAHWRHQNGRRTTGLLIPDDPATGTPVLVTIAGGEAVITAGIGAKVFLSSVRQGDEREVVAVLRAILDGRAAEYADLDHVDDRWGTFLVVSGVHGVTNPTTHGAMLIRRLRAWPEADPD